MKLLKTNAANLLSLIFIVIALLVQFNGERGSERETETERGGRERERGGSGMEEDILGRIKWMNKTLADPTTGSIPDDIRQKELAFASTLPLQKDLNKTFGNWVQQGPYNIGGRTRAIAMDLTNENNLVAGSAMGGIWRSTNGGSTWLRCSMEPEVFNISCITQDSRAGKSNIWFAGTGELYGGSIPGAYYAGNGMYKSVNNGVSWTKTGSYSIPLGAVSSNWSAVHSVVINPAIDTADVLFVANFDGIFRSINGGANWSKRRGGSFSGSSYWTDVKVTKSGVVYAALSSGGGHAGVWRSTDNGTNWINITPTFFDVTTAGRIIITLAPSDEKQVYFVANTPGKGSKSLNFEGTAEYNSLWKYTYVSADGTGVGGVWEDRSANMPAIGGAFGDYISQGGYCMGLGIKPDDANALFLGGTNLYRSTDGFSTTTKTTWIGGYQPATFLPDFKIYGQHHPDQHGVIFYPSDPKKMISVNDGGIAVTANNMASNISWTSLNHGYLTTQFYSVAIDHQSTNNVIIGGLQDNGTLFTNASSPTANWTLPLSYDGSFCYVAPNSSEYYMSIQQGRVMRLKLDANGVLQQYTRVDPKGVDKSKYQFINPFTPDANDWKVLYIPAGNVMWRNSDVTGIPLKNQPDSNSSDINWQMLPHTTLPSVGDEVTAVLSSKLRPDVLYYATARGHLYRLNTASDTSVIPQDLTGQNFPAAYINCIAEHPTDSNKLYVVFTNYGVLSIFYSVNGGADWVPISGNLEQFANGSGNGPSCRWLTVAPVQDSIIYFVGSSTGLYATKQLIGMQTQWIAQAYPTIKNNMVMMMDHRTTDGLIAVATYGAGMFTAKLTSLTAQTNVKEHTTATSLKIYPNPANDFITIELAAGIVEPMYEVHGLNGITVMSGRLPLTHRLDISHLPAGIYVMVVKAGNSQFSSKFAVIRE